MHRLIPFLLLLALVAPVRAADPALRPDSLVLNETLGLAGPGQASWPLYLWRSGEYLVEAIHEHAESGSPARAEVTLSLRFLRGARELLARQVVLVPDPQGTTSRLILRFTTDREIPLRADLQVEASLATAAAATDDVLRLQIRRKPNVLIRR